MNKREVLQNFLTNNGVTCYNPNMEVQVNVHQDEGEKVEGVYKDKTWVGWSDGNTTWKNFRIPWNANKDPTYIDSDLTWDINHAEAIGMTGWNWVEKKSMWVAFDFDAITGHSILARTLTPEQLRDVVIAAEKLPYVTTKYSTSGNGIHLYVYLDGYPTETHTEHAALARAILTIMSAEVDFDFMSNVDVCGGNMWVWSRKTKGLGLSVKHQGGILSNIPPNWRDHINTLKKSKKTDIQILTDAQSYIDLDEEHKKIIAFLRENNATWWWDTEKRMLITHTYSLLKCHEKLGLRGIFETLSEGSDLGEQNCFAVPKQGGVFVVRRYTQGIQESKTWQQDSNGWTTCKLNSFTDFPTACRARSGIEEEGGGFFFKTASLAKQALLLLGQNLDIPTRLDHRQCTLKQKDSNRIVVSLRKEENDPELKDWVVKGKNNISVVRIVDHKIGHMDKSQLNDNLIRHLTTAGSNAGWVVRVAQNWVVEPIVHVKAYLTANGVKVNDQIHTIGEAIIAPWELISVPFAEEYPGKRKWNKDSAQLAFEVSKKDGDFKHWNYIFEHIGGALTEDILKDPFCIANNIPNGSTYLKYWLSFILQKPYLQLPYLFLFSMAEDTGKTMFYEAIGRLLTKGVVRADTALTNTSGFNGELFGAIICVIEETNLSTSKIALQRIKDLVTAKTISIHPKGGTPFMAPNLTHWIQCANDPSYCSVLEGDTRLTVIGVNKLTNNIPRDILHQYLDKEAPFFLKHILDIKLPPPASRLALPVIGTQDKLLAQSFVDGTLMEFFEENCITMPGNAILFSKLYADYCTFAGTERVSKIVFGRKIPDRFVKGRNKLAQQSIGNIAMIGSDVTAKPAYIVNESGFLVGGYHEKVD